MKWQKYLENVDKNWTSTQNIFLDFVLYATYEKYKHEIHFGCYCDEVDKLDMRARGENRSNPWRIFIWFI